jgi:N-acetyl-anhydromuramyl-L-alanine amidase AmpD
LRRIRRIIVHHSASGLNTRYDEIELWHVQRGFRCIGYHYVIESDGRLLVGRPLPEMGAHTRGHNGDSIGVCCVGDNTQNLDRWHEAQVETLWKVVKACRLLWPDIQVVGHKDFNPQTECPGVEIGALLGG